MKVRNLLLALVSIALLGSCNMMKEDADETYCGLFVNFKYDYNLQRADMFKDHVGGVTLYVFDSNGRYIKSYENNTVPLMGTLLYDGTYGSCMHITDLPDGDYRFIALANQKPYLETLGTPGAKYRRYDIKAGEENTSLTVTLDRSAPTNGTNPIVSNVAPMDTLWHGMTGAEPIQVKNNGKTVAKISMVRDTKMLTVSLHNLDEDKRADIDTDDFEYFIVDNNGRLAYNNNLLPDDDLVYTPFHKWNTYATNTAGVVTEATAHAGLTFNRLIWSENPDKNATLIIRNKETGNEVAAINLTDALAQGRNAYDAYAYSRQEYLDRSYDYYLDFFIKNDVWQYAEVRINVLSWAHRIQNVNLK
jgi:hypothetical protein